MIGTNATKLGLNKSNKVPESPKRRRLCQESITVKIEESSDTGSAVWGIFGFCA
jgi:hypothetical protein